MGVLVALVGVALVAGFNAGADAVAAQASQRRAQSLDLASQSLTTSGRSPLDLAQRALTLDRNLETLSAVSAASAANRQFVAVPTVALTNLKQMEALPDGNLPTPPPSRRPRR